MTTDFFQILEGTFAGHLLTILPVLQIALSFEVPTESCCTGSCAQRLRRRLEDTRHRRGEARWGGDHCEAVARELRNEGLPVWRSGK